LAAPFCTFHEGVDFYSNYSVTELSHKTLHVNTYTTT